MTEMDRFDIYASSLVYDRLMKCEVVDDPMLTIVKEYANIYDAFDNYIRKKYNDVSTLNRYDIVNEFTHYAMEEG